jgi:hypothetical protein
MAIFTCVGENGSIWQYNSELNTWIDRSIVSSSPFYWIGGTDDGMVLFAVGSGICYRSIDGGVTWTDASSGLGAWEMMSIFVVSANEAYLNAWGDSNVRKWNGSTWSIHFNEGGGTNLWGLNALAENNMYIARNVTGTDNLISYWNGSSSTEDTSLTGSDDVHTIGIYDTNTVYLSVAHATNSKVYKGKYGAWSLDYDPTNDAENEVITNRRGKGFYIHRDGTVYWRWYDDTDNKATISKRDPSTGTWTDTQIAPTRAWKARGIAGYKHSDILVAMDQQAYFYHYNGSTWTELYNSSGTWCRDIFVPPLLSYSSRTYSEERSKKHNRPFWFMHIEGFPYLWFTRIPENWEPASGWAYKSGLSILPGEAPEIESDMDALSGVADSSSISLRCYDATFKSLLAGISSNQQLKDSSTLLSTGFTAGSNPDIQTDDAITNAPTGGGTIYIGNSTITYGSRSGDTFSSTDRGRYAILDTDLDEVKWKPAVSWDRDLDIPPLATLYPTTVRGRVVTLYRNYFLDENQNALNPNQSEIRFRGNIEAYGLSDDYNGFDISILSIMNLLDRDFYTRLGSFPIEGYRWADSAQGGSLPTLKIIEELWGMDPAKPEEQVNHASLYNEITIGYPDNINEMLKFLNDNFDVKYSGSPMKMMAPWGVWMADDGKIVLHYDAVGLLWQLFPWSHCKKQLHSSVPFNAGVKGYVQRNAITQILGFEQRESAHVWIDVYGDMNIATYRSNFAKYNGDSYYDSWEIAGEKYQQVYIKSDRPPARAWFDLRYPEIPISGEGGDNMVYNSSTGKVPDGSGFLVYVEGSEVFYRAKKINIGVGQDRIHLINPKADLDNRIGTKKKLESLYHHTDYDVEDSERTRVRQAWNPSCEQTKYISITKQIKYKGVEQLILQILTSSGTTAYNGDWDILPNTWALSIPDEYIDTSSFEKLIDSCSFASRQRNYVFHKPQNFREFLNEEAKTLGFLVVLKDGKITCQINNSPTVNSAIAAIDDSSRIADDEMSWQTSPEGIINSFKFQYDYDVIEDEFYSEDEHHDLVSQANIQAVQSIEIENKGLKSSNWSESFKNVAINDIQIIMSDRLRVWSREAFVYECRVNRGVDFLVVGDIVTVTDSRVPNPFDGTTGIIKHPGVVIYASFAEGATDGTVRVRLLYDDQKAIQLYVSGEVKAPLLNVANVAPSQKVTSITAKVLKVENIKLNMGKYVWKKNDLLQVVNIETSIKHLFKVDSYNQTTEEITVDASAADIPINEGELVVMQQPLSKAAIESDMISESKVSFLADAQKMMPSAIASNLKGHVLL